MSMIARLLTVIDWLSKILGAITMVMTAILIVVMSYEMVVRRGFDAPTLWAFDISYMLSGIIFVAAVAYALLRNEHVRIDFMSSRLPMRVQHAANLLFYAALFLPAIYILSTTAVGTSLASVCDRRGRARQSVGAGDLAVLLRPCRRSRGIAAADDRRNDPARHAGDRADGGGWIAGADLRRRSRARRHADQSAGADLRRTPGTRRQEDLGKGGENVCYSGGRVDVSSLVRDDLSWLPGRLQPHRHRPCCSATAFSASSFGHQIFGRVVDVAGNFVLIQIPLVRLHGGDLRKLQHLDRLFRALRVWIGRSPGGLSQAVIIMCAIFSASSGTVGACEIVVGLMAIPAMMQAGYKKDLISGTICGGGSLGTIIPPSVTVVVYATVADLPMGDLIAGTMIPGLVNTALFMIYIYVRCRLRPQDGPPVRDDECNVPLGEKLWLLLTALFPCVALIFAVLGTIFMGIASPTESAAIGALGALLLVMAYGDFRWPVVIEAFKRTVLISAMAMAIILGGTVFTSIFMVNGGHTMIREAIQFLDLGVTGTIMAFLTIVFLLGFILEWISILLITIPIFSAVVPQLGIDPLWFAVLVLTILQTSYLTPPMAPSIFYLRSIAPKEITYMDMYRGVIPFLA